MQQEKSILARFVSEEQARLAAGELESLGYKAVPVDRISDYGTMGGIDGQGSHMTMFSGGNDLSGNTGQEKEEEAAGGDFMVVMTESDGRADRALEIIRSHGGQA